MKRVKSFYVFLVCLIFIISIINFIGIVSAVTETRTFSLAELGSTPPASASEGYCANLDAGNKVCQLKGYDDYVSYTTDGWGGCANDYAWDWYNNVWKRITDCNGAGRCLSYMLSLTCTRETCTQKTCTQLGKECGTWTEDGCNTQITCGDCSVGSCIVTNNLNVALNKPATATSYIAEHPPAHAVDGNLNTYWGTGDCSPATLTIDLQSEQLINNYSISCGGIAHGNKGIIKFYNSANSIVAQKNYVCDLKGTSSGLTGILSPAINVNKVIIEAQSNGNSCNCIANPLPANCGDYINLIEFQAYSSCDPVANCIGKSCGDGNGCGGTCAGCIASCGGKRCDESIGICVPIAHTCSSSSQTIMKLSKSTNSLGALWNDTSFTYDICYNEIFGENYAGANPHECTGNNKLINLQQSANSLGEIPSLNNYNIPVCYGNLLCLNETGSGNVCSDDADKLVARLYSNTNSNISNASDVNFLVKICCRKSAAGNTSWENMNGVQITSANVSDSVRLVVKGEVEERTINYTIKKCETVCTATGGLIKWFDNINAQTSGKGFAVWKTSEEGDFYFIARILDASGNVLREINSFNEPNGIGKLKVKGIDNSLPKTQITKPINETNYTLLGALTNEISFEQISSDEDDDLIATWDFGDGNITLLGDCLSGGNCNITHAYNSSGTKIIGLTVKETTRIQQARDFTRIFIYKPGMNIFAIIDEPSYKMPVTGGGQPIIIRGDSSHVANCFLDESACNSAAGVKGPCYLVRDTINPSSGVWCYKHALSNQLSYTWIIDPGKPYENITITDNQPLLRTFTESGEHDIKLKVSYTY
ncbi:MAG: PKD domain-containing protein [Nanoarchaeota archaeon]